MVTRSHSPLTGVGVLDVSWDASAAGASRSLERLEGDLTTAEAHYGQLMSKDVAAFNAQRQAKGLPGLSTTLAAPNPDKDAAGAQAAAAADVAGYSEPDRPH